MARRRKKTHSAAAFLAIAVFAILAVASWWLFLLEEPLRGRRPAMALSAQAPAAEPGEPSSADTAPHSPGKAPVVSELGVLDRSPVAVGPQATTEPDVAVRIAAIRADAEAAKSQGNWLTARAKLGEALQLAQGGPHLAQLRADLSEAGRETILSPRIFEDDPHVGRYVIQPGDTLAKIAANHRITADLLANINGIADKNLVRAGQTIKVIHGPFDAVVEKSSYTLDLYLGGTFVRSFPVGLGADDGTPTGRWRVSSKLVNPTYYPPRGGKIIAADDPQNPLGERWIGLTGIEGSAVGQERYGIHGTIEPDSIGQSTSMGCVRLLNEDVEHLYTCLVERHSTVTIR